MRSSRNCGSTRQSWWKHGDPPSRSASVLLGIDGVNRVTITSRDAGISGFELGTQGGRDVREAVCQKLTANGWTLRSLELKRSSLEETVRRGGDRRRRGPFESRGDLIMRHVPTLLARELGAFFLGPMAYIVLMAFQVIALLNFWELVDALSQPQREFSSIRDPMTTYVSSSPLFWFSVLVAVPLLTMRLIAEERRTGTIETLLTLPVSEAEIVFSKWLAGRADVPGPPGSPLRSICRFSIFRRSITSTWDRLSAWALDWRPWA